jgi:hypothetical protein
VSGGAGDDSSADGTIRRTTCVARGECVRFRARDEKSSEGQGAGPGPTEAGQRKERRGEERRGARRARAPTEAGGKTAGGDTPQPHTPLSTARFLLPCAFTFRRCVRHPSRWLLLLLLPFPLSQGRLAGQRDRPTDSNAAPCLLCSVPVERCVRIACVRAYALRCLRLLCSALPPFAPDPATQSGSGSAARTPNERKTQTQKQTKD